MKQSNLVKSRLQLKKHVVRLLNNTNLTAPAAPMDSDSFFKSGCPCCTVPL